MTRKNGVVVRSEGRGDKPRIGDDPMAGLTSVIVGSTEVRGLSINTPMSTADQPLPANEWYGDAEAWAGQLRASTDERADQTSRRKASAKPGGWLAVMAQFVHRLWEAYQQQREMERAAAYLATLDDRTLRDVGLHRSEIGDVVRRGRL